MGHTCLFLWPRPVSINTYAATPPVITILVSAQSQMLIAFQAEIAGVQKILSKRLCRTVNCNSFCATLHGSAWWKNRKPIYAFGLKAQHKDWQHYFRGQGRGLGVRYKGQGKGLKCQCTAEQEERGREGRGKQRGEYQPHIWYPNLSDLK